MRLKHVLRQIEPHRGNLRHDRPPLWIVADPPWHIDAVGGAVTSSEPIATIVSDLKSPPALANRGGFVISAAKSPRIPARSPTSLDGHAPVLELGVQIVQIAEAAAK